MSQTTHQRAAPKVEPLSQLMPFDQAMLRQCIAYLSFTKNRALTQLFIVKLNVLIDLFHILRCAKPLIGGSLAPWESGPIVPEAYRACDAWKTDYDYLGKHPAGLKVTTRVGTRIALKSAGPIDPDDFSQFGVEAMEQAWSEIGYLNYEGLRHYTHSPDTFLGAAYTIAREENRTMDWEELIAHYDRFRNEDHSSIRALIRL